MFYLFIFAGLQNLTHKLTSSSSVFSFRLVTVNVVNYLMFYRIVNAEKSSVFKCCVFFQLSFFRPLVHVCRRCVYLWNCDHFQYFYLYTWKYTVVNLPFNCTSMEQVQVSATTGHQSCTASHLAQNQNCISRIFSTTSDDEILSSGLCFNISIIKPWIGPWISINFKQI